MSYISATTNNNRIIVWERNEAGERVTLDHKACHYFYYDDPDGEYRTIFDTPVSKIEFDTLSQFYSAKKDFRHRGIKTWESDIPPELRWLSNEYYNKPAPKLHVTYLDIEVDYDPDIGYSTIANPYAPINSVALLHHWKKEIVVIAVPPDDTWTVPLLSEAVRTVAPNAPISDKYSIRYELCADETELLLTLLSEFRDSDVLCGWNSDFFDMPYITQRIARVLDGQSLDVTTSESISENGKLSHTFNNDPNSVISRSCRMLKQLDFQPYGMPSFRIVTTQAGTLLGITVDLIGRVPLDYMALIKKYEPGERASYKLASVSEQVLVDKKTSKPMLPKLEYQGSLADLYRNDFAFFIRYNIRDTEILDGFEQKLGYVELANQMAHLSTGLFSHVTGTLKLAELALINYCHHTLKRVVNNVTMPDVDRAIDGALVLLPQIGLHEKFGSIDINSLYPSAIRSLNISPETIRGQFVQKAADAGAIANGGCTKHTLVLEKTAEEVTLTADEWRVVLRERCWAISGYGTVFDQSKQGFIPALLSEWYASRKKYQALKKQASDAGDAETAGYMDRLQYVYKIKLNSLYGALTNLYFRFYDLRMGESTTASGRAILRHQCRMVAKTLEGNYNVDFPLFLTVEDAFDGGYTEEEARDIALNGPRFNGRFQSDAVIYGDTDSTYFKTYATTIDEAIAIADAVAEKVNQSYPEFMRQTFLCTPGYDNIIKAGREIVSDRGIFVEKKRYILHLINSDGETVDKMKIMGLDTKKTTLPAEISAKLNGFIEQFLKGESWESISEAIVQYKETLASTHDIMTLGLPKGIKGIEEYASRYEKDPNTRLPGHVAAAIHYNIRLQEFNDKVSPAISSGMKIKVFYLLTEYGRFKSIALPTDLEVIPQWFTEQFTVDIAAHIQRLVDNPLLNILKAIGKEVPSRQSLFIDSMLVY